MSGHCCCSCDAVQGGHRRRRHHRPPIRLGPVGCGDSGLAGSGVGSRTGSIPSSSVSKCLVQSGRVLCNRRRDCPGRSRAIYRTGGRNRGDYWNSAMHAEFVAEVSNYPGSADFARQRDFAGGTVVAAVADGAVEAAGDAARVEVEAKDLRTLRVSAGVERPALALLPKLPRG